MPAQLQILAVALASLLMLAAAEYYRHLDERLIRRSGRQLLVGVIAGGVLLIPLRAAWVVAIAMPLVMTLCAIVLKREGHGVDRLDALFSGAFTGAITSIVLAAGAARPEGSVARLILSGAAASVAASELTGTIGRRAAIAAGALAAAVVSSFVPVIAISAGAAPLQVEVGSTLVAPAILIASVFWRRRMIARELEAEAELGVLPREEIACATHPLRRITRCGWHEPDARRRFVTLATELALQKRRQRSMDASGARLQQLEILKTRMELKEVLIVHHLMSRDAASAGPDGNSSSDTIGAR